MTPLQGLGQQAFGLVAPEELVFDRYYLGGPRLDDHVLVCIAAGRPRGAPKDLMICVATTAPEDWSFSGGEPWMPTQRETTP